MGLGRMLGSASFVLLIAVALCSAAASRDSAGAPRSSEAIGSVDTSAAAADSLPPVEKMPVLTRFVKADYPPQLLKAGVEGAVVLDLVIDASGRVDSVAVVKGLQAELDSSAARAARGFLFSPAIAAGKPVPVLLEYNYRFSISQVAVAADSVVNFHGRLVERGTRAPIRDATVIVFFPYSAKGADLTIPFQSYLKKIGSFGGQMLQDGAILTTSDSLGFFQFRGLPACAILVKIVAPNFDNFVDREQIKAGEATGMIYRLHRNSFSDYEVLVYGKGEKEEVSERTLTQNEVQKIPGFGGDAVKVIEALPGVARPSVLSGQIIIRGSATGDSHFYIDGVTLPTLFHFGGLTSTYNSEALQNVDLYPGGFGTRYGDAMGGVVDLTGRKPKTDRLHGYIDVNLFDASFLLEGPLSDNVSFLVTARRSYIANVLDFFLDKVAKIQLPFTVVPYYWDYVARLDADLNKNNHVYVTFFGSEDRLDLLSTNERGGSDQISSSDDISDDSYFHMGIAAWQWTINNKMKNDLHYSFCRLSQDESLAGFTSVNGNSWAQYLRDEFTIASSEALKWHAGVDIQEVPYNLTLAYFDNKNNLVRDTARYNLGPYAAYAFLDWKPTPKLTLTPGVRYDYYPELHYDGSIIPEFWNYDPWNEKGPSGEPSFRLSARYAINDKQTVKASAGTYNETPQPIGQAIDPVMGNPDLGVENCAQYVAGYEWKLSDLVSADLQAYYNRQWNDATRPSDNELADDPSLPPYIGNGLAQMHGIELLLKHDQSKRFFGWIAYSLSRSERWNYDENQWALYNQDQTNNLQLIGSYKVTPTQEAGVRFQFVTGDPTTPIIGSYYDATNVRYVPIYGPVNSSRMGPYINLDLRYEKKFVYTLWQWSAYIDVSHVENWFGKGYHSPEINQYEWNYNYTESTVLSDITRPAIGVRMEF